MTAFSRGVSHCRVVRAGDVYKDLLPSPCDKRLFGRFKALGLSGLHAEHEGPPVFDERLLRYTWVPSRWHGRAWAAWVTALSHQQPRVPRGFWHPRGLSCNGVRWSRRAMVGPWFKNRKAIRGAASAVLTRWRGGWPREVSKRTRSGMVSCA